MSISVLYWEASIFQDILSSSRFDLSQRCSAFLLAVSSFLSLSENHLEAFLERRIFLALRGALDSRMVVKVVSINWKILSGWSESVVFDIMEAIASSRMSAEIFFRFLDGTMVGVLGEVLGGGVRSKVKLTIWWSDQMHLSVDMIWTSHWLVTTQSRVRPLVCVGSSFLTTKSASSRSASKARACLSVTSFLPRLMSPRMMDAVFVLERGAMA